MAGEVLNMNDLTINKHRGKLKVLCFKTTTKPYTKRWPQLKQTEQIILLEQVNHYQKNYFNTNLDIIMNSKLILSRPLLVVTLFIVLISSCEKDKTGILCGEVDYGTFRLLENSINSIPYQENTLMIFHDSIGNKAEFELDFENGGYEIENINSHVKCEDDTTLTKIYKTNIDYYRYDINEINDSLNLKFVIKLEVEPYFQNIGTLNVSDQLDILRRSKTVSYSYSRRLNVLVNSRELSEQDINLFTKPIENITLLGRTFHDAYSNLDTSFVYNYEFGMLAFKDWDDNLWVLKKSEKKN
jgi:hypothetical protein